MKKGLIVDIGTGDGKFVHNLAQQFPDRLFIGIDPNHKGLVKKSLQATKKKKRGGLENVVYVLASVEELPEELKNIANQVFINFPWGSLLSSIVNVEEKSWENIRRIMKKDGILNILLGYSEALDKTEINRLNLPELNKSYIHETMTQKVNVLGFELIELEKFNIEDLKDYPTTWSKKMAYCSKPRTYYHLQFKLVE